MEARLDDALMAANVSEVDVQTLVAELDTHEEVDAPTSKRLLARLLSPAVANYNQTVKPGLAPNDQAMIVFEDEVRPAGPPGQA